MMPLSNTLNRAVVAGIPRYDVVSRSFLPFVTRPLISGDNSPSLFTKLDTPFPFSSNVSLDFHVNTFSSRASRYRATVENNNNMGMLRVTSLPEAEYGQTIVSAKYPVPGG
jgi:hypothetical protein